MISTAAALRAQLSDNGQSPAALESQMTPGSLKYPVLTLPNEITVEIFLHFVSLMRQIYYRRPQPYYGLLRLACVCQTWRAVTLYTCALWNDIVIVDCDGIRDAGQLLKVCLPRAGSLPLDLDIGLPEDNSSMDTIVSTLGLYGSQWRRIRLSSPAMPRIFPIDRFPSSLPLLECLTLSDLPVNDESVFSLRHAPHLRELSLRNSSSAIQLGLPFNKLTKLDLSHFYITELLAVLPYTLNLESLRLAITTKSTPVVPQIPSILLPHLHTFACRATIVLQYLTLPALERLVLLYPSDAGVHAILSCVARSGSTIHTLNLIHLNFNAAYDYICSLPTIKNLCLSFRSWSLGDQDRFFAAMISGSCLPALESLTCKGCRPMRADKLFAVVSARWRGVEGTTTLNSVSLDFDKEDSNSESEFANAFDQLYELGRQGLKLEITGVGITR